ncbi:MAG: hypothetical protein P8L30_10700 [Longimicrobiales bacterium]|nr:hypothetical protein [Longimicrobiales bacterium]
MTEEAARILADWISIRAAPDSLMGLPDIWRHRGLVRYRRV